MFYAFVISQFRTQNRFQLLLDLLQVRCRSVKYYREEILKKVNYNSNACKNKSKHIAQISIAYEISLWVAEC